MVTIGSLKYDIIADTANFQKGMVATRRELTAAKRVFAETRTPAENLGFEIEGLSRLLKKGAIDQETYNRAVKDLNRQAKVAQGGLASLKASVTSLSGSLKATAKAWLVFQVGRGALQGAADELQRIDDAAKKSRRLGLLANDLIAIRLAGEQLAGTTDATVDMALQRMVRRIAEAANGSGEAKAAIEELGLSAKSLKAAGPAAALAAIADAFQNVTSEADQTRLAQKLFDSEGVALVNVLREGGDALDAYREKAYRLGLTFDNDLAASVEKANDSLGEAKLQLSSAGRDLTQFFVPAVQAAADAVSIFSNGLSTLKSAAVSAGTSLGEWWGGGGKVRVLGNTPGTMAGPQPSRAAQLDEQNAKAEAKRIEEEKKAFLDEMRQRRTEREAMARWEEADRKAAEQRKQQEMEAARKQSEAATAQQERQANFERANQQWEDAKQRAAPGILDANSAEGFAALRSSMKGGPEQVQKDLLAEQKKANGGIIGELKNLNAAMIQNNTTTLEFA